MMNADVNGDCVLLPAGVGRSWVVPQCCLGEIVTVPAVDERPPQVIEWRGQQVPVANFDATGASPWRESGGSSGLVAVVLGERDERCQYFGIAVRGDGLGVIRLADADIEDLPCSDLPPYTLAAFRLQDNEYQVPDLLAVQRAIGSGELAVAESAPPTAG
jgi:chemotaxis signal transduction protein